MGTTGAPGKLDPIRNSRTRQRTGASLQDRKSRNSWPDLVVIARCGDRATRTQNPTREKAILGTTPFQHVLRGAQLRPHRAHRELCAGTLTRSCPHPFLLPLRSQGEKKKEMKIRQTKGGSSFLPQSLMSPDPLGSTNQTSSLHLGIYSQSQMVTTIQRMSGSRGPPEAPRGVRRRAPPWTSRSACRGTWARAPDGLGPPVSAQRTYYLGTSAK